MARKPKQPTTIEHDDISTEEQQEHSSALTPASEHSQEIMDIYGDGLVYNRARVVDETRFYMAQSAETMLEAGKRLIILKEHEPHGEFIHIVESQLGMAARTAQQIMQAAIKYCSPKLDSKRQAFATLGKTKLFELMVEDDDDLSELADGGSVAGMNLDDIDRMSVRELKKALRDAREEREAKDRVMEKNRAKIDELQTKAERVKKETPDEVISQVRAEASQICNDAEATLRVTVSHALEVVFQYGDELDMDQTSWLSHQLDLMDEALLSVREKLGIERSLDDGEPVWADPNFDDLEATE